MSHVKPHWTQPSHPDVQTVNYGSEGFTTASFSKVNLPPFGLFAKLAWPPCDMAEGPTYATVQFGRDRHLNLNSDLLYINHSCEPTLIFDTGNMNVIAGPNGLKEGQELSFFYPSTEWDMAQAFDCLCKTPTCRGRIAGAKDMPKDKLAGLWLNGHIREMLEEREGRKQQLAAANGASENGVQASATAGGSESDDTAAGTPNSSDPTELALKDAVMHAEKVVESARSALQAYLEQQQTVGSTEKVVAGSKHRGITSRELSGERGGDTVTGN